MKKGFFLMAGAVMLVSGAAWADMPTKVQAEQERVALAQTKEAGAAEAKAEAAMKTEGREEKSDLHPAARPVYNNGGHFGSARD